MAANGRERGRDPGGRDPGVIINQIWDSIQEILLGLEQYGDLTRDISEKGKFICTFISEKFLLIRT